MRQSFGFSLTVIFAVSIFTPLVILSVGLSGYFNHIFVLETKNMFSNTLFSVSHNITTYIEDLSRISMTPYFYSDSMGYLNDINSGKYFSDPVVTVRVNKNYNLSILNQLSAARKDALGVIFAPYDGESDTCFLVRRYSGSLHLVTVPEFRDTEWYNGALSKDGGVFFAQIGIPEYLKDQNDYFYTDQKMNVFSVARLIKDPDTMRPLGVMKVDAVDTVIREIFRHFSASPSSTLMLLDQNNNIIYSTNDINPDLLDGVSYETERVYDGSDAYYVSAAPISSTPWRLCYFASESDIRQKTMTIYYVAALLGIICLAVAMLIFYMNSRNTIRSMNELLSGMQKIASGNFDMRLNIMQKGYMSVLASALSQTASRLEDHIQREYKAVLNQRNAEYLALQSQINPHFLNNVLSGFVTLNKIGERDTLERSIIWLSRLFRYSAKNENLSTVTGELEFVKDYLALQKMRFAQRLAYDVSCSEQAAGIPIPKLLLQPLVENSIIHGMEPYQNNLLIEVSAEIIRIGETPCLMLIVSDDGAGFNMKNVSPDSVGLANVTERLELFHADSIFQINSGPDKGCRCIIIIPA